MSRLVPACLSLLAAGVCAAQAANRFTLVRSDSDAGAGDGDGIFSLDDSTLRLACVEEAPDGVPAEHAPPVAILCHGLAGTKESPLFDAVSKAVRSRGIAVARFDFNGHGESEGAFGSMTVSNEVLDVETVVDYYRNVRGARVALVGHSQGGVVAALAAARLGQGPVEALALLAPAAVLREDAQRGRIFDAVFDPLDPPETIPVMGGRLHLGRAYVLDAQETDPYAAVARFRGPLLVVHGQADTVVPWSYGQRFVDVRPDQGELVLVRPADHSFTTWEDTVGGLVADFLARSFGTQGEPAAAAEPPAAEPVPAPVVEPVPAPVETAEPVPAPVETAEPVPAPAAEPVPAPAAEPVPAEIPAEASEAAPQELPVELPPDIRGDIRAFLATLDSQSPAPTPAVEPVPAPVVEPVPAPVETAEPVPAPVETAEPVPAPVETAEPVPAPVDEPVPAPVETAEPVPVPAAEPVPAPVDEPIPAAEPAGAPDSVQAYAAAYPPLPLAIDASVINILAAPNGLTWQGLEVEESDMVERLGIFGASIPEAHVRIQAFPETPVALVKTLVDAARAAGFSRVSVLLPSAR